jgi:tRNA 2-thiouridine synthesizing protein A
VTDQVLDAKGLLCPVPIINITRQIKKMQPGQTLLVYADDPVFKADLEAWCRATKNILLNFSEKQNTFEAIIQKR